MLHLIGTFADSCLRIRRVLIQLPSGLSNGGLLQFTSDTASSTTTYSAGFKTAQSLVEVAIGLTVGLFLAAAGAFVSSPPLCTR